MYINFDLLVFSDSTYTPLGALSFDFEVPLRNLELASLAFASAAVCYWSLRAEISAVAAMAALGCRY